MTPGAVDSAREREASRGAGHRWARLSGALGLSVAVHVLGAVALWRGVSEPERFVPPRPLEVELVWREAAGSGGPGRGGPGSASAGAPAPVRVREKPSRPRHETPPPVTRAEVPPEEESPPVLESQAPVTPPAVGNSPEAVAAAAPGGSGEGGEGSGPAEGAGVGSGTSPGSGPAGGPGVVGAGVDLELRAYREQLSRRVTRQRRYPSQAVRLGMEGTALVRVRINRDGSLGAPPRLEGSSRFRVLDVEALRMVEAAAPFAPLPAEPYRESAEFVIPVSFSLRAVAG
ncbi:energy transducer TonB [Archangium lipolyticum]|uniref:energy transducer TonB n=1 Tax=Archangium lipolyticum TaxID=2970465 RepID=UPI00214A42D0|nr:energy transducer TonB [Archangium lipolyticum]